MTSDIYEILALAMRYVFTLLGVVIVWRSFSWLRKDRRLKHRRLRQLPDAGTIGILTVEEGSSRLHEGSVIPVPHEGVLGFLRTCDMVVPVDGVADQHLDFIFRDGKGLYVYPRRGCSCAVDGVEIRNRRDSRMYPMQHNSTLTVGNASLRLGVFAGLNVAQYTEEPAEMEEYRDDPRHAYIPPVQPPRYPEAPQPPYPEDTRPYGWPGTENRQPPYPEATRPYGWPGADSQQQPYAPVYPDVQQEPRPGVPYPGPYRSMTQQTGAWPPVRPDMERRLPDEE